MEGVSEVYEPLLYGGGALLGLICCFFGFKDFKLIVVAILAVAGAAVLAYAGYTYGEEPVLWSLGGLLAGAILGGVLALFFYSLAVGTIGALFAATTLLPYVQDMAPAPQAGILGIAALVAALLTMALTNLMIQLATAMVGAWLLVHGVRYFLFDVTIHKVVEDSGEWILRLDLDPLVAVIILGIGLVGFLMQRRGES